MLLQAWQAPGGDLDEVVRVAIQVILLAMAPCQVNLLIRARLEHPRLVVGVEQGMGRAAALPRALMPRGWLQSKRLGRLHLPLHRRCHPLRLLGRKLWQMRVMWTSMHTWQNRLDLRPSQTASEDRALVAAPTRLRSVGKTLGVAAKVDMLGLTSRMATLASQSKPQACPALVDTAIGPRAQLAGPQPSLRVGAILFPTAIRLS
mmetsp:Transcript_12063/g.44056  ORF Transcript_12063/g.44056 Transcript_12063/m.44056 type:complete len:204 (-) Transcript_12063:282-893(-)